MDKSEAATNAVRLINLSKEDSSQRPAMILAVCSYFDIMKGRPLSNADKHFLHYLANKAGLPQYYFPMLNIGEEISDEIGLQTLSNFVFESSLTVGEDVIVHRYQKEILDRFNHESHNRFFLSASTSFGKTFLVYEIIRKMKYKNIILVFPTIALLSENLTKINMTPQYAWVKETYKVHTMSDIQISDEYNLFMYTPERYLSFVDKNSDRFSPDFVFIDEAYKIDNSFVIDDEEQENERDITYRVALHFLLKNARIDCLLAAPYVENIGKIRENRSDSFGLFLTMQDIDVLDYNRYEIVGKSVYNIAQKTQISVADNYTLEFSDRGKVKRFVSVVRQIVGRGENLMAYVYNRQSAEAYAKKLLDGAALQDVDCSSFREFISHLDHSMNGQGVNWIITKALKKGIGIHHGLVPKYIQNEIINLFNKGCIHTLICTTTITEGVNTTAKNVIVLSHKKGIKSLKKFDAKNIEGRAGRFLQHYRGRVFILEDRFNAIMRQPDEILHHNYYDHKARKNDIDLMFVQDQCYLNNKDKRRKEELNALLKKSLLPSVIGQTFTTISVEDKVKLYQAMNSLSDEERKHIDTFVKQYHKGGFFQTQYFDIICSLIRPIVHNRELASAIDRKLDNGVCLFAIQVRYYLQDGLIGCILYKLKTMGIDSAVRESTKFVFNTLKYYAVRYLGLFNLVYKVLQTEQLGIEINEAAGIDYLLSRFEFNAVTLKGRMVSDLGVPQKVIDYFDMLTQSQIRKADAEYNEMDAYEKIVTQKVLNIIGPNE